MRRLFIVALLLLPAIFGYLALSEAEVRPGNLVVVSVSPAPRTMSASTIASIEIEFDRAVNRNTIDKDSFWAFGRWSGAADGEFSFSNGDRTVTLTPDAPFSAGESVMVILANTIAAADGSMIRSAGYSYQFMISAAPAAADFTLLDTLSTRTQPGVSTRAYGGVATDMDNDGWLDLSIVNEDTADVRVFLNQADGSGNYHDFLQPPTPVGQRASPSEPSDFNRDGHADLAVVNIDDATVSILLGLGNGFFEPQQVITVGAQPRGVAILDADGDGDTDVVNTNSAGGGGNLSLMLNDGSGSFGLPTFFDGGGTSEWALAAADMNEDFILDLVIGARATGNPTIVVNRGNGDGTFSFTSSQSAGGAVWMLNAGDVNGDGHEDVATANSSNNNGAILLGDGAGNLAPPQTTPTDSFPLATDLGDIDGDGDLDWAISSFSGDWQLFLNDGSGSFDFDQSFPAPQAASCALMLDFDNDGDLDLALIDELADVVILMKNLSEPPPSTATPTATATSDVIATATATGTLTSTASVTPSLTPSITPSSSATSTTTPTPSVTPSAGPTLTATPTATPAAALIKLPIILYQDNNP